MAASLVREIVEICLAAGRTWSGDTERSSARGVDSRSDAAKARPATAGRTARNLARVSERYTETAIHFDVERLPALLSRSLPTGPLALADLGCGDGPLFAALSQEGAIDATRPVYAVTSRPHGSRACPPASPGSRPS